MSILRMRKRGEINWTETADPVSMQWTLQDIEGDGGSGRNQMGETFRDRIAQKRELALSWGPLEEEPMSDLLSCLNDNFFEVEYPDALTGKRQAGVFYVASKQSPMYSYDEAAGKWLWNGMTATLAER